MSKRIFIWNILLLITMEISASPDRKKYEIQTTWDGISLKHDGAVIYLNRAADEVVEMEVLAPFYNDPPAPDGKPGPFPQLWEYEVVEAFFLGDNERYLEVELSPHGQHLLLFLDGAKNAIKQQLPLEYKVQMIGKKWYGVAKIPASYFPPGIKLFNAYAIHGSNENRVYETLYPTPTGKYDNPDFHRLEYLKPINFEEILPSNRNSNLSQVWKEAIDASKE